MEHLKFSHMCTPSYRTFSKLSTDSRHNSEQQTVPDMKNRVLLMAVTHFPNKSDIQ